MRYNTTSLMPNNTDPLIFFQDIKAEYAHILENSRRYQLAGKNNDNSLYIREKQSRGFIDAYLPELFNMIVARIKATQAWLNQDNEPFQFEVTRYKNSTYPSLNYNNLNNTCAINIGKFGSTITNSYAASSTLYTHTNTVTSSSLFSYTASETAIHADYYTTTSAVQSKINHFSLTMNSNTMYEVTTALNTYTRNNTTLSNTISYSSSTKVTYQVRSNLYTFTRFNSSTLFSNTQNWTAVASDGYRHATYTRANTALAWQSTINNGTSRYTSATNSSSTTLPTLQSINNSAYTRGNIIISNVHPAVRQTANGASVGANATSYRETYYTRTWFGTTQNKTSVVPGSVLGAWQTTSKAGEVSGGSDTNYVYIGSGTYHTSLMNNANYSWTGEKVGTASTYNRITGYGTSGTVSNASSYRETQQSRYSTITTSRITRSTSRSTLAPWISQGVIQTDAGIGGGFSTVMTVSTLYSNASQYTRSTNSTMESYYSRRTSGSSGAVSNATSYLEFLISGYTTSKYSRTTKYNTVTLGTQTYETYSTSAQTLGTYTTATTEFFNVTSVYNPWYSSRSTTYQRTYTEEI